MRKVCPNFDREDGLETILEVPVPEEMFTSMGSTVALRWQNMAAWMKAQTSDKYSSPIVAGRYNELSFLLFIVGSPLIPLQVQADQNVPRPVRHSSIEASTAKYIIQQYIAATGGQAALNALQSMCAIGELKISASDFHQGDESVKLTNNEEAGGFVIWHKNPDLWCLELLVSGCKVISGCNGEICWRQSSNQQTPIAKGPPRPLRRFLQGLDPRSIANLFLDAQISPGGPERPKYEIITHTLWGYFSQRSGLLVKFEDSRLLSVKTKDDDDADGVFWETSAETVIEDYRYVENVNIAHSGKTFVTVYRYGEQSANHRRELREAWKIDEIDFNVWGLTPNFFMPPSDSISSVKFSR
ncbi:hypothetical protein NMG60_11007999 [Bertholletia excelsa]